MTAFDGWLGRLFGRKDPEMVTTEPSVPWQSQSSDEEHNEFALAMHGQCRQQAGNMFFSPLSIRAALLMAHAGAAGETAAQMAQALHTSSSRGRSAHAAMAGMLHRLDSAGSAAYEIAIANSLWGQEGEPFRLEFLELIAAHYAAALNFVDFCGQPDDARATINQWVEERTRRLIRQLIPPGGVTSDTRLALVNAVYFKGKWSLPFEKTETRDQPFYLEGGRTAQIPLMRQENRSRYVHADDFQAVDLSYQGNALSMLVLLPHRKDGLRDLESRLSQPMLRNCSANMFEREVILFLPRCKVTWGTADVRDQLKALGMTLAFSRSQADFSGMNGFKAPAVEALFISAV